MARKLARSGCPTAVRASATGQQSAPRTGLAGRLEKRKYSRRFGVHLGNPGYDQLEPRRGCIRKSDGETPPNRTLTAIRAN